MDLLEAGPRNLFPAYSHLNQGTKIRTLSVCLNLKSARRPLAVQLVFKYLALNQNLRNAQSHLESSSSVSFPVPNIEPEPEKRQESSRSLAVPNFIRQYKPNWNFGEDLPDKVKNIIFSKDVNKLLHIRSEILETLEEVDIDTEIADISPGFLKRLHEAVGTALPQDDSDPKMKVSLKEFQDINYVSPSVPTGRINLRDDYLYTWYLKPRIHGQGKRKSEKTVPQYATYIFGKSDNNLYKFLESKNILCENAIFPASLRITKEVETWTTTDNPSTSSKFFFFS